MRSNPPKRDDIREFFSKAALRKAEDYQMMRRVSALRMSDDLTVITARVAGSERVPYGVDILLTFDGDELIDVDGDCSCPMVHNCKHVAATLLEAFCGSRAAPDTAPLLPLGSAGKATLAQPVLTSEIKDWLEKIDTAVRGNDYPADVNHRLLYCVQAHAREGRMPHLAVSLLSIRLRKDGNFSDQVSRPAVLSFSLAKPPAFLREADIAILSELSGQTRTFGQYDVHLVRPVGLLRQIVDTGRAYWRDHSRPPLRWGESRQGRVEWRRSSQEGIAPHLLVEGAIALGCEPPVYVDEAAGMVGPVETGMPVRLAYRLLSAPIIPPSQAAEVARRLGQKLPTVHHDLLPAPPAAAIKIDQDPTPVLRLMMGKPSASGYSYYYGTHAELPVAQPSFRYGPIEVELTEKATTVESFHDGQIYAVSRARTKERDVLKRLAEFGFQEARLAHTSLDGRHRHALILKTPGDWFKFLEVSVGVLRAEGFDIRIDDDFPYRLAESSDVFDAEFESSGIDWFELGLGIEIDGERRDLTSIVATLVATPDFALGEIRRLAEAGDRVYLPLPDGRHVSLAADRFLPLILALHTLNLQGAVVGKAGKIRLSRAEIVPLLGLENEAFAFKGLEGLRRLAGLLQARGLAEPAMPEGFKATLRPYQAHGVAWLDLLRESGLGGVLADDMGLGKTVQVLALLALEKARGRLSGPALVVAPTSLMTNWSNEARRFAPELRVLVLHGALRKQNFALISEHDLVLTTYPLIARDHEVLLIREWEIAVLDEAQTIKNPNAATTRWLRGINARHRFCLTGTPMENHLGELWSIMTFVNPGYLGDKAAFTRQWRGPIEKRGDTARAAALAQRVKPFLLRRTKEEVAPELPPKSEIIESIVLEGSQRDLYDSIRLSMSEKVRRAIKERGLAKSHIIVLEALLRLRQACCHPALLKLDDGVERPAAKLERLMEMVLELLSEGRKILVFSQFTSMLALIRSRFDANGIRYSLLTGDTRDRRSAIEGFQGGATDVFLISLKAGGVGLNLTAADTVIVFDPWWNPAVEEQAIDRAHRIGQHKAVFVYRLVASGTIEEKMDELKARKRELADSLFDSDGRVGSALTEEDVKALFEG